jgi:uncharacterized protein (DUF924 family)
MNCVDAPEKVLNFWYSEAMNRHWFKSTPDIDENIRSQFELLWQKAAQGELNSWMQTAEGCLALIILLDQLPLNMFRGKAKSFSTEAQSIECTLYGIERGFDKQIPQVQLSFFYMPLMHSELLEHQDLSVQMFERAGLGDNARFARHHRGIIHQFGRFPHRNKLLARESTEAERDYLQSDQAFKG